MGHSAAVLTTGPTADAAATSYVLHIVPANGGGVDRYVRDICAHRSRDCILHVVQQQCVFEVVASHRFIAIDHERFADACVIAALGQPALIHAHSTLAAVREHVALLSNALGIEYVVTLHDIDFAAAFAEVDDNERTARLEFVRNAAQRIVPSAFISRMLSTTLGPETTREVIENGVDGAPSVSEAVTSPTATGQFPIAVVGALGPHKGLNFLYDIVAALPPKIRVAIIGYADGQITPGWLQTDRLWVHGAFEPRDLPGVVRGYGASIALFPNRQPESYSYALSDAWCAGLPALGPALGAIGERIAQTGGGWTYEPESSAEYVAARLLDCVDATDALTARVLAAAAALPSTRDMVKRLNKQYKKIMSAVETRCPDAQRSPHLGALEAVVATQLNGRFFRSELNKLAGDLVFSQTQAANAHQALQAVTKEYEARGVWIAALENSLSECRAEITRVETARIIEHEQAAAASKLSTAAWKAELADESTQAEMARVAAHGAHERYAAKLQQDVIDTLAVAHRQQHTIAVYERALLMIPSLLRQQMLARAARLTAVKAAQ